jgi:hypothetical protein
VVNTHLLSQSTQHSGIVGQKVPVSRDFDFAEHFQYSAKIAKFEVKFDSDDYKQATDQIDRQNQD